MVVEEPPGFLIERLEKRDLPFGCAIFKEGGNSTKTGASAQSVVDNGAVSLDWFSAKSRGGRLPHHRVKEGT